MREIPRIPGYVTVPEAADQLGVSKAYVHKLIKADDDLPKAKQTFPRLATLGEPVGARTIYGVHVKDVEKFQAKRQLDRDTTQEILRNS